MDEGWAYHSAGDPRGANLGASAVFSPPYDTRRLQGFAEGSSGSWGSRRQVSPIRCAIHRTDGRAAQAVVRVMRAEPVWSDGQPKDGTGTTSQNQAGGPGRALPCGGYQSCAMFNHSSSSCSTAKIRTSQRWPPVFELRETAETPGGTTPARALQLTVRIFERARDRGAQVSMIGKASQYVAASLPTASGPRT